jgi:hypothetical protein
LFPKSYHFFKPFTFLGFCIIIYKMYMDITKAKQPMSTAAKKNFLSAFLFYLPVFLVGYVLMIKGASEGGTLYIRDLVALVLTYGLCTAALILLVLPAGAKKLWAFVPIAILYIGSMSALPLTFPDLYIIATAAAVFIAPSEFSSGFIGKGLRKILSTVFILLAIFLGVSNLMQFGQGLFLVGWFICSVPHLAVTLFSRELRDDWRKTKQIMQGTDGGAKIFSYAYFWAFNLAVPIILGPAMLFCNFIVRIIRGIADRHDHDALSVGEEVALELVMPERGPVGAILDAANEWADDVLSRPVTEHKKMVFKRDAGGALLAREEGALDWKKVDENSTDSTYTIDGNTYKKTSDGNSYVKQ